MVGVLIFSLGIILKSFSSGNYPFLTGITLTDRTESSSQTLFIQPPKNFLRESPEMSFIQNNSVIGVSPPITINPQVLGSVLGGISEEGEERRGVIDYVVEPGDTLSSIADKFDISLNTILWANNLNLHSVIKPGQRLIILPVSGVLYLVKKGDTLSEIAEVYKSKVEEIIAFNELSSEGDIYVGDILVIPGGKPPSRISFPSSSSSAADFYMFPCEGKITQGLHYYNAIDIANKCGAPVVAVSGGIVQRTGWIRTGGRRVTILHSNGIVTYYGHLSKIVVAPGQRVNRGDIIGYMGRSGYATGCHLHFGVRGARNFLSKYPVGSYLNWKE